MKKSRFSLVLSLLILPLFAFNAFAEGSQETSSEGNALKFSEIFKTFIDCKSAYISLAVFFIAFIFLIVFRKKIYKSLSSGNKDKMSGVFLIAFGLMSGVCLVFALITDGKSWSRTFHQIDNFPFPISQFSDYLAGVHLASTSQFSELSKYFSPFAIMIYLFLSKFMPADIVKSYNVIVESSMIRNQSIMFLYLLVVLFTCASIYKINQNILLETRRDYIKEILLIVLFLSFPSVYCIELGNIAGVSLALCSLYILLYCFGKKKQREFALVALGAAAAITPSTIIFALLMFDGSKTKKRIFDTLRAILYCAILSFSSSFVIGSWNALSYFKFYFTITPDFAELGNTSVANLFVFLGVKNTAILWLMTLVTTLIALMCMIVLKKPWMKALAGLYIMLNFFEFSSPELLIFATVPLILLLREKKHEPIDWVALLDLSFIIIPIPAWYYFDENKFSAFLSSLNLDYTVCANNLFSLAAVQAALIILITEMARELKERTKTAKTAAPNVSDNKEDSKIEKTA